MDLRSPSEYARDHLPRAVNVPLFDDDARAVVGTLYHKESPSAAYETGLALAERRMPALLERLLGKPIARETWQSGFQSLASGLRTDPVAVQAVPADPATEPPDLIVHCWRGGMRSRSVAALLTRLGVRVGLLEGGHKGYREWVRQRTREFPGASAASGGTPWFVLVTGATGTGKTLLLKRLEEAAPGTTLDLEGLAAHRSSILGAVGREPVGQAMFESRLAARLDELGPPPWFIEAESRKVGDVVLPERLYHAMRDGRVVELRADTEFRVRTLIDDYLATPGSHEQIAERLPFLEKRLGAKWVGRLGALLEERDYAEVTRVLLERYYDPLYAHSGRDLAPAAVLDPAASGIVSAMLAEREQASRG